MVINAARFWQSLLLVFVVVPQGHQLTNGQESTGSLSMCSAEDICVTEKLCDESDDSGRDMIGPRLALICGQGLICCDRKQLESWNATMEEPANRRSKQGIAVVTTTTTTSEEPSGYESCDFNMECVPRKLCRENKIIDDGAYILTPRLGYTPCLRALHRCCGIGEQVTADESSYTSKLNNFKYQGCGHSNPRGLIPDRKDYNYTEDVSLFGQFPWMMAVFSGRNQYLSGGTLIHPQLVLTSAHNMRNQTVDTLVVRAGEYDLISLDEPYEHQARRLKQLITHEDFDPERHFNDIALLVLQTPVDIKPHIQPLCLPPPETPKVQAELRDALCFATGWGARLPNSSKYEHLLKRIDLPVVSKVECEAYLRVTGLGRRFRLRPSFLCAGGVEGKDTCKGDGGSPLFCTLPGQPNRYQLAGIVSWGIESRCAEQDVPAVYANVPYLRSWIDEQVKSLGFQLDSP